MKRLIKGWCSGPKDLLAIMVVFTWCVAVFLPENLIDEVTQRSFERILLIIVSYFFGSHSRGGRSDGKGYAYKLPVSEMQEDSQGQGNESEERHENF